MITKRPARAGSPVKVTFSVPAESGPTAVVGDFNDWDPTANPMRKRGDRRSVSVELEPGRSYSFRYVAGDGRSFDDDSADDYVGNEYGESNCVVDLTDR